MTSLRDAWGPSSSSSSSSSSISNYPQVHSQPPPPPLQHHIPQPYAATPHYSSSMYPTTSSSRYNPEVAQQQTNEEPPLTAMQLVQGIVAESESFMNNKMQQMKTSVNNHTENTCNTIKTFLWIIISLILIGFIILFFYQRFLYQKMSNIINLNMLKAQNLADASSIRPEQILNLLTEVN